MKLVDIKRLEGCFSANPLNPCYPRAIKN